MAYAIASASEMVETPRDADDQAYRVKELLSLYKKVRRQLGGIDAATEAKITLFSLQSSRAVDMEPHIEDVSAVIEALERLQAHNNKWPRQKPDHTNREPLALLVGAYEHGTGRAAYQKDKMLARFLTEVCPWIGIEPVANWERRLSKVGLPKTKSERKAQLKKSGHR
jgi:hypothetical protein